jgi:hypothetical protein
VKAAALTPRKKEKTTEARKHGGAFDFSAFAKRIEKENRSAFGAGPHAKNPTSVLQCLRGFSDF